jgi:hypothetical protein
MKPYIFRVIREKVGDETVRILLEPFSGTQVLHPEEGDEFITGTLKTDPWDM